MFNFLNKTDTNIKQDVFNELMWDPSVTSSNVKIFADDGVVTLRGTVPHYIEKMAAVHAAQRIGGVKAVADELEVKGEYDKSDEEIARAALNALKWNYAAPPNVKISVEKGWVTLEGESEWNFQRNSATDAVSELLGVSGVTNNIKLKSKVQPSDVKALIEEALMRSAEAEGRDIRISVKDNKVTLSGNMHSFAEIEVARHAAWNAPGVTSVVNNLMITI